MTKHEYHSGKEADRPSEFLFACEKVKGLLWADDEGYSGCEEDVAERQEGGVEEEEDTHENEEGPEGDETDANL